MKHLNLKNREGDKLNKALFRSKMALFGDTYESLATFLNLAMATISNKVNGNYPFNQIEIAKLKEHWNLTNDEVNEIFFS